MASMLVIPVVINLLMSVTLVSRGIGVAIFCSPSRGETSIIRTADDEYLA